MMKLHQYIKALVWKKKLFLKMSPKKSEINYNKNFKIQSSENILHALITPGEKTKLNDKKFRNLLKLFNDIRKPKDELDWLVRYNVRPQSCHTFLEKHFKILSILSDSSSRKIVYYVKIGNFNKIDFSDLLAYSKIFFDDNLIQVLPYEVEICTEQTKKSVNVKALYDKTCLDLKIRYEKESKNFQIRADSIHEFLTMIKPKGALSLIGFTEYDIYIDESDLFVAGLCNGYLKVGVFSIFRYMPKLNYSEENWYDYSLSNDFSHKKWLLRSCKLMVHETCHLLGFGHCVYKDCCMNGSGHLKEDFRQSMFLCPIDLKKLWLLLNFDIKKRYELLRQFFDLRKCNQESKLLTKILKSLD